MDDGCGEGDGREEDLGAAAVVSGRDAPPILEPAEHALDPVAPLVAALVIFDWRLALISAGDAGAYPFVLQRFPKPVRVIAAIPEQPFDLWQAAEQRPRAYVVTDLPGGDEQVDRSPLAVADGVKFCVHAALCSTDQATAPTFLAAMLVAVRWAFRYVASIITVFRSPCSAANPAIIRAKMPFSLHPFHRL